MKQTIENIAALRCKAAAKALESAADTLGDLDSHEAINHASEARGAAKIARQWARELEKLHRAKQRA
jgi:hypothetical protein